MNERITELMLEAGRTIPGDKHIDADFCNKFAELIVRECVKVCESRVGNRDYNTGRMHCASDLKEHFGVDE